MPTHTFKKVALVSGSLVLACAAFLVPAAAQKDSTPKPQNSLALAEDHVKQLLLIMQANAEGKISKQQYMKFMEAEFERLDKNKTGELDVKSLMQPNVAVNRSVGK
jgi:hypothetical protein